MRTIAEGLLLREATTAEFWVLNCAGDIAFSIDEIHGSRDADRSALWIDESFHALCGVIGHG